MPKKGGANKNNSLNNNNSLSLESNVGMPNNAGNNAPEVKVNSNSTNLIGKVNNKVNNVSVANNKKFLLKKENIQQLLL